MFTFVFLSKADVNLQYVVYIFRQGSLRPDPYIREPDMHRPPSTAQQGASVASMVLDDPDFYRRQPAKMRTIPE